ncbi:MAG: 1-acyl-sn-glycerol-3-phosphate acyltransferase [Acidobacteria bacterium]|nr:1-acyl-sn-glycerol-3-phosphate acyltransferase [Acidobacteriota bacterium]
MAQSFDRPAPTLPRRGLSWVIARIHYLLLLLVGAILMLVIGIPIIYISKMVRTLFGIEDFVYPLARIGVRIFVAASGARVDISGLDNIDPAKTYVFVANHQSNLDPPILFAWLPHNVGGIAKKELEKIPFFRQGFSVAHIVSIDRKNRESAIESTRRGAEELRNGHSLIAFPEGTRSADGQLKEFKKGIFFMAIEARVPIVPIAFNDTGRVMPKHGALLIPGRVSVEVLPPIDTRDFPVARIEEIVSRTKEAIASRVRVETIN